MTEQLLSVTEAATNRVQQLTEQGQMLRLSVKQGGCSGMSYQMDLVDGPQQNDLTVTVAGSTVLVDPAAALYLTGSTMDYVETPFKQGFEFVNPNEKSRCGCGESFSV